MSAAATLLARTFLIGIAVAAPVGAMGVLCIQRTLRRGWRAGVATGLGIATADGGYAALAAFGITALSQMLVTWQTPLRIVGGLALVYLGVSAAFAKASMRSAAAEVLEGSPWTMYASAVGLTATNPMTIMAFAAVFASAGLAVGGGWKTAATATLGVAVGSLSWWLALTTAVSLVRHALSLRATSWVNRISGAVVATFGLLAILSVFASR